MLISFAAGLALTVVAALFALGSGRPHWMVIAIACVALSAVSVAAIRWIDRNGTW